MQRKPIRPFLRSLYRVALALHVRSYETYQPVGSAGRTSAGTRECETRWNAVRTMLETRRCQSIIDLGCSEGYYVLQAARMGVGFCVGIDFDLRRICTCQSQVLLDDIANAAFLVAEVRPALIEAMPRFDAVVFLSVLHHILAADGEEAARAILGALARKVDKVMIFEMGQSDERSERWAARIPDMGRDPHTWIADLLSACGFSAVEKIAEAPSYRREVSRAIFACTPALDVADADGAGP